ncbi:putative PilU [Acidithiobacillus ferrivorans]|uniref:PilU n=1 Tax=Acidithiobacillus ferrivorans TaxID=160808 RepID=A0ABY1MMI0_9PROT|nr:ATPase, T2SS/T4P/T4SS family [Acidithiobacillus ferrivorans]SMH64821.1 putative PilU [Acidithiobacillus ferrivorans]
MSLVEVVFSDLFVTDDPASCWYKVTPDSLEAHGLPQSCHEELARLRALLIDRSGRDKGDSPDFKVDWQETRLRVERMDTSEGAIYVCRRYGVTPRHLADLGFPPMIAQRLLASDDKTGFREGLVAFLGRTGSGKSTAAAAYIIERLEQSGGVCWTAENPIELALQGRHGKGVCYQLEVADDHGFGEAIRHILRASPNLILIGEIRDKTAAQEAIHAALTGHLVVTTLHANDLLTGLARLARLAGDPVLLADALRAAMHLRLSNNINGNGLPGLIGTQHGVGTLQGIPGRNAPPQRILTVEPLLITGENVDGLRSTLRGGEFHLLKSEVDRQRRLFMGGGLP